MKQELEGLHDLQASTKHIETNAQDYDPEVRFWEVVFMDHNPTSGSLRRFKFPVSRLYVQLNHIESFDERGMLMIRQVKRPRGSLHGHEPGLTRLYYARSKAPLANALACRANRDTSIASGQRSAAL